MKTISQPTINRSFGNSQPSGFALIVTLSLMILLTVIAVGLLTLASISLRTASQGDAMASARANARMSMTLALGDLQKYAGKDQAVTARADILVRPNAQGEADPNNIANSKLTGVWKSWNISATSPPSSSDYDPTARKAKFLTWLTSSPVSKDTQNLDFASTSGGFAKYNAKTMVKLWSDGTLGKSRANSDVVIALKVATAGNKGAYAYAVLDEGVKVRVNTPYKDDTTSPGTKSMQLGAGERPKTSTITGFTKLKDNNFEDGSTKYKTLEKAISSLTLTLASSELGGGTPSELKQLTHDITTNSTGLFTNTAKGGLRKDFHLLTETDSLPSVYAKQGVYQTLLDMPSNSAPSDPKWDSLKEFAQVYRSSQLTNNGGPEMKIKTPSDWQAATSKTDPTTNVITLTPNLTPPAGVVLAPVIDSVQLVFSLVGRELYRPDNTSVHNPQGDFWKGTAYRNEVGLLFTPVVTIRNPYNVTIVMNNPRVEFSDIPFAMQVFRSGVAMSTGLVSMNAMATDNQTGIIKKYFSMNLKTKNASGAVGSGQNFKLLPGEVKIFSPYILPTWTWENEITSGSGTRKITDWYARDGTGLQGKTSNIDATTGWHGDGIGFHRDWLTGSYSAGRIDSEGRWAGCFGVRATDTLSVKLAPTNTTGNRFAITLSTTPGADPVAGKSIISALEVDYTSPTGLTEVLLGSSNATLTYPESGTVSGADITDPMKTGMGSLAGVKPMAILTIQAKTTLGGVAGSDNRYENGKVASMPWVFGHPSAGFSTIKIDPANYDPTSQSHEVQLQLLSKLTGTTSRFPNDPQDRTLSVSGRVATAGNPFGLLYEVPIAPIQNFATLNGANPGGSSGYLPRFAQPIGNSWANPMIAANSINQTGGSYNLLDHSFLMNLALYDNFYFSGLASKTGAFMGSGPRSSKLAESFAKNELLDDPRLTLHAPDGKPADKISDVVDSQNGYKNIAAWQLMNGAFNVNSTSVSAWKAMLGSVHDPEALVSKIMDGGNPSVPGSTSLVSLSAKNSGESRFSRFRLPVNGPQGASYPERNAYWMGSRVLSDQDLDKLAHRVVEQVHLRGPFLSMAEFVNRRLSDDDYGMMGALQQAIDKSAINETIAKDAGAGYKISSGDISKYKLKNQKAGTGYSYNGAPGAISQADLLNVLGDAATVRSDTFTIRAYGETRDPSGKVTSSATCEAVVQRFPEYIDNKNAAETEPASLTASNTTFGRRFEIISFRWLSPDEI